MADYDYDIGVIGGGAAGLTVTSGAAQLGAKTSAEIVSILAAFPVRHLSRPPMSIT